MTRLDIDPRFAAAHYQDGRDLRGDAQQPSVHRTSGDLHPSSTVRTGDEVAKPVAWMSKDGMKAIPDIEKAATMAHSWRAYAEYVEQLYTVPLYAAPAAPLGGVSVPGEEVARAIHYPECWDTTAYPTLGSALAELAHAFRCTNQDTHANPQLGGVSVPPEVAGQRPSQDHPESCGSTQPAAVPATQEQQWCCIAGKAMDVNVCWECAQASAGYSAAMADAPTPAAVPAYQPMTDEEIEKVAAAGCPIGSKWDHWFARAIESAVLARVAAAPAAAPVAQDEREACAKWLVSYWRQKGFGERLTDAEMMAGHERSGQLEVASAAWSAAIRAAAPAAVQPVAQQQPSVHQVVGSGLPSQAVRTGGEGA